jgi:hypothetical protein
MVRKPAENLTGKGQTVISSKLSLIENSYNFLNQSLVHYRKTGRNIHEWPFAVLHITQSIELMLKHVLKTVHPILIFEDIDHPRNTVSLERALIRLETVGITVGEKEKINIRRATSYRNQVVHYEFDLNKHECKKIYAQLFEFTHFFHLTHFDKEIHAHIRKTHWAAEARLMRYFQENFVSYNGVEMFKDSPAEIMEAQRRPFITFGSTRYARLRYGEEGGWWSDLLNFADTPCHDCGAVKGQYHSEGCDVERCPKCHSQLLGCECWS